MTRPSASRRPSSFVRPPKRALEEARHVLELNASDSTDFVTDTLAHYPHPSIVPLLAGGLKIARTAGQRERALFVLSQIHHPSVIRPIVRELKHPDALVRRAAVWALSAVPFEQALAPLLRASKDPERYVARETLRGLGRFNDARAVRALCRVWKREQPHYLTGSTGFGFNDFVRSLGNTGHALAVKKLFRLYTHPQTIAAPQDIADALGLTRHPDAVKPLLVMMRKDDRLIAPTALRALEDIHWLWDRLPSSRQPKEFAALHLLFSHAKKNGRCIEPPRVLANAWDQTQKPGELRRLQKPGAMRLLYRQLRAAAPSRVKA